MIIWLILDIKLPLLNGSERGALDGYLIEPEPFCDAVAAWYRSPSDRDDTYTCMCSYSKVAKGAMVWGPPYAMLGDNSADNGSINPMNMWGYCNTSGLIPPTDNTTDGNITKAVIMRFMREVMLMATTTPTTATLLSYDSWRAARLSETARLVAMATARAKADLHDKIHNKSMAYDKERQLDIFEVVHLLMAAKLHNVLIDTLIDNGTSVQRIDLNTGHSTGAYHCPDIPTNKTTLPYVLLEFCCPNKSMPCPEMKVNCSDPYQAYMDWCEPKVCHHYSEKTRYVKAMQIMSAIGGMYDLITLFAVLIVWNWFLMGCWRH